MISQLIFNALLKSKEGGIFHKFLSVLRKLYIKLFNDRYIKYKYKEFTLQLPISHDYPFNLKRYPAYSQNLGIIANKISEKYPHTSVIDVGANVGDSVAIIHSLQSIPILCIEGNPKFIPVLTRNIKQFKIIDIANYYVSDKSEFVKTVNYLDTARLETSSINESIKSNVKTMDDILRLYPAYKNAKLLKIDTDGFDNKIIRSSTTLLQDANPIVFFEYDPKLLDIQEEKALEVFNHLNKLGYHKLLLFDNFGNLLCETTSDNELLLSDLTIYYRKTLNQYLDICAFHLSDNDLLIKIKNHYT